MLKIIISALFVCILTAPAYAAQSRTMRDMAIKSMSDYAKKLYARHDYREANRVFRHILTYDAENAMALFYLDKMYPNSGFQKQTAPVIAKPAIAVTQVPIADPTDPNADLKIAIAEQDKALDVLREEVRRLRVEVGS